MSTDSYTQQQQMQAQWAGQDGNQQAAQAAPFYYQQQPTAIAGAGYPAAAPTPSSGFLGLNVNDTRFWKGVAIGAAVALLVTNDSVQRGVVRAIAKVTAAAQSGIEEMKEKFEDAKAETEAEK